MKYATKQEYYVSVPLKGLQHLYIIIDKGWAWNGCSKVVDACRLSSCVHDWLYCFKGKVLVYDMNTHTVYYNLFTKSQSDRIYSSLIVNPIVSKVRLWGLSLFGKHAWNKKSDVVLVDVSKRESRTCPHNMVSTRIQHTRELEDAPFVYCEL